jgi:hypothetical protein
MDSMQFFYVKKTIALQLPHKQLLLEAPQPEALNRQQIPISHIYCGNVAWEVIHAKEAAGEDSVVVLPHAPDIHGLLPNVLRPYSSGADLVAQIRDLLRTRPKEKQNQPVRIALINGVGTMIGDTLVGTSALEIAIRDLRAAVGEVEVHAVLAWNARPGTELIMARSPAVSYVHGRSISLAALNSFDAYFDFSALLRIEGYDDVPLIDFYLNQLGIDPSHVPVAEKVPQLRLPTVVLQEARALVDDCRKGRQVVLVQGLASTPLRSMPEAVLDRFIDDIMCKSDACVLLTHPVREQVLRKHRERLIQLSEWCQASMDRYLALVVAVDALVSIDSLAIHVAAAARIPGIVIFTTLDPHLRLAYAPRLTGLLIPGAVTLPTWGKHKTDSRWEEEQVTYNQAWDAMDRVAILDKLASLLNESKQGGVTRCLPW